MTLADNFTCSDYILQGSSSHGTTSRREPHGSPPPLLKITTLLVLCRTAFIPHVREQGDQDVHSDNMQSTGSTVGTIQIHFNIIITNTFTSCVVTCTKVPIFAS